MKKILISIVVLAAIIIAGCFVYKNYFKGGNKIIDNGNKNLVVRNFDDCVKAGGEVSDEYPDQCVYQGDMVFVKDGLDFIEFNNTGDLNERLEKIGAVVEKNEQGQDELVFNDFPIRPIKSLNVDERNDFMNAVLAAVNNDPKPEKIMKEFPGIKKEDFENTGNLESSIDFQILLNNILERIKIEPRNGEDLSYTIEDLKRKN